MRATRAASEQQLFEQSAPRLESLLAEGVATVEIKSGYGLTLHDEARMLRVARQLGSAYPVTVRTTFLGAHALPPEFKGRPDAYIDVLAQEWLPTLHAERLVDAVDIFCESIAFSADQAGRLFEAAERLGLRVKMHAEQLSNIGGSKLAARFKALSCDHLEYSTADDVGAMAQAGTVAVLLPVAFYSLAETRKPPVEALRQQRVPMAIGSDCNPGSAPGASILLAMNMASRLFGLTSEEVLAAVTRHGARALGEQDARGRLAAGFVADFAIWEIDGTEELGYWSGYNPCRGVIRAGRASNLRARSD
jgi:imidazolonepropionase